MKNKNFSSWFAVFVALIIGITVYALLASGLFTAIAAAPFFISVFAAGLLTLLRLFQSGSIFAPSPTCNRCAVLRLTGSIATIALLIPGLLLPAAFTVASNVLIASDVFFLVILLGGYVCQYVCQYQSSRSGCSCQR